MIRFALKAYLVYLAISVLLILPALNILAPMVVKQNFQRDLKTEIILFNPFNLSLVIRKASLPENNGDPFTGFSYGEINFSLESIWSPGLVLDALRLEDFYVDVLLLKDGSFNFSDLLVVREPEGVPAQNSESSALPGITIRDFHFHSTRIKFTDQSRVKPFSTHYDGLDIAMTDFSTVIEEGKPYRFEAKDEAGGVLRWEGNVSVPGARSDGSLSLTNISLAPLSRFIEPWVKFELTRGNLNVAGRYSISWADTLSYQIDEASVTLKDTAVAPQQTENLPDTGISLGELQVSGVTVDGTTETVGVESVSLDAIHVKGWSEGSQVSLAELFAPRTAAEPEPDKESTPNNWSVVVNSTTVGNSEIHWRSEYTEPALTSITPISISVSSLRWPLTGDARAELSLAINRQASFNLKGQVELAGGNGQFQYALGELPLPWFNPNLPKTISASIGTGQIDLGGSIELENFMPARVSSDGAITGFSLTIKEEETELTSWDTLQWKKLGVDLNQKTALLEELLINNYSGRLHIHADGTINAQRALVGETGSAAEVSNENEPAANEPPQSESTEAPWSFSIPSISIADSALDFMDESLPIPFRTVIGELNGGIDGLGSKATDEAVIDLTGSVDGYAPVKLAGTAKLFAEKPALDLGLNFDGVDLARLTPYSGTYAGRAIDRGVLKLDLHYQLNDSKLVGKNRLVIEQLKLGEKVKSDKAVDLPLNLAIALLKDANGVIDMAVPVSGNIDDPKFGLGGIIFSALVNVITKAVTAPFSLLAKLIGSEQDLQRVTFPSGTSALDEAGQNKLRDLATAFEQRPGLILVIAGRLHPQADRLALQRQQLKAQAIAQGITAEQWDSKGPQREKFIDERYKQLGIAQSDLPVSTANQFKAVTESLVIEEGQLEQLAEERAVTVKRFLVNEAKLPADRAVIDNFDAANKGNQFSGTELEIKT